MSLQIGKYKLTPIETGRFGLDGGAMFGVVPQMLWGKTNPPDKNNRVTLAGRALLITDDDGKAIIVDTGMGEKYDEKQRSIYNVDNSRFTMMRSLEEEGFTPEDITHVIITHLHFDHAGGLTSFDEKKNVVPTFPNAKVLIQKDHLAWANNPTDKDRQSFFSHDWKVCETSGMIDEIDGAGQLFPGIELMVFQGHTRSQQLVHVHAGDKHVLYTADLFPTKAHLHYPYIMSFDNEPLVTLQEKKSVLPRAYEEKWLLHFEHDPDSTFVKVAADQKGFVAGEEVPV